MRRTEAIDIGGLLAFSGRLVKLRFVCCFNAPDAQAQVAASTAPDFLTIVSSANRNDLDVWTYLKDVLDHLLAGETGYAALSPDVWRQTHPEAIREYRVTERRDRAHRKQYRRAARRRKTRKPTR